MIGIEVANELAITRLETLPSLFIGDNVFTVIGIIDDAASRSGSDRRDHHSRLDCS